MKKFGKIIFFFILLCLFIPSAHAEEPKLIATCIYDNTGSTNGRQQDVFFSTKVELYEKDGKGGVVYYYKSFENEEYKTIDDEDPTKELTDYAGYNKKGEKFEKQFKVSADPYGSGQALGNKSVYEEYKNGPTDGSGNKTSVNVCPYMGIYIDGDTYHIHFKANPTQYNETFPSTYVPAKTEYAKDESGKEIVPEFHQEITQECVFAVKPRKLGIDSTGMEVYLRQYNTKELKICYRLKYMGSEVCGSPVLQDSYNKTLNDFVAYAKADNNSSFPYQVGVFGKNMESVFAPDSCPDLYIYTIQSKTNLFSITTDKSEAARESDEGRDGDPLYIKMLHGTLLENGESDDDKDQEKEALTPSTKGCELLGVDENGNANSDFFLFLQDALDIMQIVGPALAMVLGMVDLLKATASGEEDAKKKASKSLSQRILGAVILYLLPAIIELALALIGKGASTCGLN